MYIICHIFVGHNPERDELMACTYHNMRLLDRHAVISQQSDEVVASPNRFLLHVASRLAARVVKMLSRPCGEDAIESLTPYPTRGRDRGGPLEPPITSPVVPCCAVDDA